MIVHKYKKIPFLPGEPTIEFKEMTVIDLDHISMESVREDGLNPMASAVKERKMQRLFCILRYGEFRVGGEVGAADVLAEMPSKAMALFDEARGRVHGATEEETSAFFETHSATEV